MKTIKKLLLFMLVAALICSTGAAIGPTRETEANVMAKCIWGEARGCSVTEQAAVAWCILNRVDNPAYPDNIVDVITQPYQFSGYSPGNPIDPDILALCHDVIARWDMERYAVGDVGRVLPKEYLFFTGDGRTNHFRTGYKSSGTWDWSLPSPYIDD